MGLGRSLRLIGDTSTRVVATDRSDQPWDECFDQVLPPSEGGHEWLFLNKLDALKRTDADQVLFIDGDTLAFKRLDDIFEYCSGKGLCVQGNLVRDGHWHLDIPELCKRLNCEGIPKFNGGMIYYERTPECEAMIDRCYEIARQAKEFGFDRTDLPINDEITIAIAMAESGNGHLIPDTYDFQNSATGLVGKLFLDVRTNTCKFICRRFDLRLIQPYLFHASRYSNFLIYWRQLSHLEKLAKHERTTPFGYMSPWQKIERSVQKRILKYIFKKN